MTWRWVVGSGPAVSLMCLLLNCQLGEAFVPFLHQSPVVSFTSSSSALFMGMNRKGRRKQKKQKTGTAGVPNKRLKKIVEETRDEEKPGPAFDEDVIVDEDLPVEPDLVPTETVTGGATRGDEPQQRMDERPEVSQVITDDETGFEMIQQGQKVMDVVTRKAVKLSDLGPEYRLAQMFPGVPPDIREKYRFEYPKTTVVDIAEKLRKACSVVLEDGSIGIPPIPSVANKAIDFVLANRDHLSYNMKQAIVVLTMRAFWKGDKEQGKVYCDVGKNFYLIENYISAPFRQMILDGEGRVGPNFGNLDLKSYCGKELYERCADYIVLKGMVCHWTEKYRQAEMIEKLGNSKDDQINQLFLGDPKRFEKNNQIIWRLKDCEQILAMALKMCNAFVETPELFNDLPPELRFLEKASTIRDGTALRQYVVDVFCPEEGIEPAGLREGMRRLYAQLDNMQIDPYGDICNVVDTLIDSMSKGTDDEWNESNPYWPYVEVNPYEDESSPAYFETYTFNEPRQSVIRFLDRNYIDRGEQLLEELTAPSDAGAILGEGIPDIGADITGAVEGLFDLFGEDQPEESYETIGKPGKGLSPEAIAAQKHFDELLEEIKEEEKLKKEKGIIEEVEVVEEEEIPYYKVPDKRALGRPHEQGWLDDLDAALINKGGKEYSPGRVIMDDTTYESDISNN